MKDKLRKKFIAGVLLSTFALMGLPTVSTAQDDYYGYNTTSSRPALRGGANSEITIDYSDESSRLNNGDSIVNLSLKDADVKQVLRMFADQAGMNIIFSGDLSSTTPLTMDLVDVSLNHAFDLVVRTNNLYYNIENNTILVSNTAANVAANNQTMTIIPVRYVSSAGIAYFINAQIFGKSKNDTNGGKVRHGAVSTNPSLNQLIVNASPEDTELVRKIVAQFDRQPTITTFKVNHMTPADMANAVCNQFVNSSITPAIGGSSSDSSDSSDSGASAVVPPAPTGGAAGIPTGFASDEGDSSSSGGGSSTLSSISSGAVTACTASGQLDAGDSAKSFPSLNFTITYFPTQGLIQMIGGSETQIEMIKNYIAMNDKKPRQAYLEVEIVELSESGSKTFDNQWTFLSKNFSFNADSSGFRTNSMYPVFFAGHGYYDYGTSPSYDAETDTYTPENHLMRYSGSPTLSYTVKYLIENEKARTLAHPRMLLTNGQSTTLNLSTEYIDTVDEQMNSSGVSNYVERTYNKGDENGIKMEVTAFISPDGYVTLDLTPSYGTIAGQVTTTSETGVENIAATLISKREITLKGVRVKDGETLTIAGLIQENEKKTVKKIPFLGDIPVVGMFFRTTVTGRSKDELVILITPQIIIDNEDAVASSNDEAI